MADEKEVWKPMATGMPQGTSLRVQGVWDTRRRIQVDMVDFRFPDGRGNSHYMVPRADQQLGE